MIMPARKTALELQDSGDDTLVHDRESRKIHVLNRSAAIVLRACDGRTPVETVVRALDPRASQSARADIQQVLTDFAALGLIDA
jgi:hypothetical protein